MGVRAGGPGSTAVLGRAGSGTGSAALIAQTATGVADVACSVFLLVGC